MIERQFLIFKTANQYNKAVARGDIKPTSIAFVVEDGTIRTHGFTFGSKGEADKKHVFITQEAYDALEEYDENTIYFILEPGGDDPIPPVSGWVFDGYFPVILS